jgi:hypothetical protein
MYGTVQVVYGSIWWYMVVYIVTKLSSKNPPRPSTWSRKGMRGDEIHIGDEEQYETSLEQ